MLQALGSASKPLTFCCACSSAAPPASASLLSTVDCAFSDGASTSPEMAGSITWLSCNSCSCCMRKCAWSSLCSLFFKARISLNLADELEAFSPALGECTITSNSASRRFCIVSCLLSCSWSSICAMRFSACSSRFRCMEVSPSASSRLSSRQTAPELPVWATWWLPSPAFPQMTLSASAVAASVAGMVISPGSASLSSSSLSLGSVAVVTESRFCTIHLYFCKCDLMFALVSPSTFMSRKIDLGLALSRPRMLHAASKRACRSGVQTKRRFC
mmetsp:Transcript_929/g.2129  ORF Transcript_929/g.2129 Transcript_929/m.2129 type:complete len:273 (+) Transcript_929:537-1355(+)